MDQGLAGYVCCSANTLFQPHVQNDRRYVAKIDDPQMLENTRRMQPAKEVIGLPIFASDDKCVVGDSENLARHPRAVVLLINKVPNAETKQKLRILKDHPEEIEKLVQKSTTFELQDVDKAMEVCSILGRCHHIINMLEQMYSMRSICVDLDKVNNHMNNQIDSSQSGWTMMQKTLKHF